MVIFYQVRFIPSVAESVSRSGVLHIGSYQATIKHISPRPPRPPKTTQIRYILSVRNT